MKQEMTIVWFAYPSAKEDHLIWPKIWLKLLIYIIFISQFGIKIGLCLNSDKSLLVVWVTTQEVSEIELVGQKNFSAGYINASIEFDSLEHIAVLLAKIMITKGELTKKN